MKNFFLLVLNRLQVLSTSFLPSPTEIYSKFNIFIMFCLLKNHVSRIISYIGNNWRRAGGWRVTKNNFNRIIFAWEAFSAFVKESLRWQQHNHYLVSHIKEEKNKKFEYAVRMSLSLCYTVYIEILTDSLRFHIVFFHWNGSVSHANEHLINTNNDFSRISFSSFFSFNLEEISTL